MLYPESQELEEAELRSEAARQEHLNLEKAVTLGRLEAESDALSIENIYQRQQEVLVRECPTRSERMQVYESAVRNLSDKYIDTFKRWDDPEMSPEDRAEALTALGNEIQSQKPHRYATHINPSEAMGSPDLSGGEAKEYTSLAEVAAGAHGLDVGGPMERDEIGRSVVRRYEVDVNRALTADGGDRDEAVRTIGHELAHTDQDEGWERIYGIGTASDAPYIHPHTDGYYSQPFELDAEMAGDDLVRVLEREIHRREGMESPDTSEMTRPEEQARIRELQARL